MSLSVQTEPANYRLSRGMGCLHDPLLTQRMLESAGAINTGAPHDQARIMSLALIRIGQLVINQPLISHIDAAMTWASGKNIIVLMNCVIELIDQQLPALDRIALAPYPVALTHETKSPDDGR